MPDTGQPPVSLHSEPEVQENLNDAATTPRSTANNDANAVTTPPSVGAVLDELEGKARAAIGMGTRGFVPIAHVEFERAFDPTTALALIEVARRLQDIADGAWTDKEGWTSVDSDVIEAGRAALGRLTEGRAE